MGTRSRHTRKGEMQIMTEEDIREALLQYAESYCCYGRNPARKMNILRISTFQVYRYHSDVFVEYREMKLQSIPYPQHQAQASSFIDGPEKGAPPNLWEMQEEPPNGNFKNAQMVFVVPHTSTISNCNHCKGTGCIPCLVCSTTNTEAVAVAPKQPSYQRTRNKCPRCGGEGHITEHIGEGQTRQHKCWHCGDSCVLCLGDGKVPCKRCHSSGLLKSFQELEIKWKTISEWNVVKKPGDGDGLRPKHLATVTGESIAYESQGFHLHGEYNQLDSFPDSGVRESSNRTYTKLAAMAKNNANIKILKIKQTVVTILVAEVDAVWDDKVETFFVFGNERQVYFPNDYPENCCRFFKFQCYVT